jgi:pimeloyl-[acyl-carrier protein] methyl ester esterase
MSDKDFATTSVASSAQDAAQLARQLGKQRIVVNGWSLGGAIAVATAGLLGNGCAGVVLTAAATPRYTQAEGFPYGAPAGAAAQSVAALRADRANFLMALTKGVSAEPQSAAVAQGLWSIFMQPTPAPDDALAELDRLDQRAALAALDVPVLSIVGARDAIVPADVCRQAAMMAKHGRAVEFAQSGHAPFLEEGPRYREVLLDVLGSLG